MIKFFRNIRKKLLSQNRFSKYLVYAVGEIVLVMVGILLALQVNNWNEERKIKRKEVAILKEIKNSIEGDFDLFERVFKTRLDRKKDGIDSLMSYVFNKKHINDSSFLRFYENMKIDISIRFNNGAYEALKSTGLDVISNDSLRTAINKAFTVSLPAFKAFTEYTYDQNQPEIDKREYVIFKFKPVLHEDGRKHFHFFPKVKDIIKHEDFHVILELERQKLENYSSRLESIKEIMETLNKSIKKELAK